MSEVGVGWEEEFGVALFLFFFFQNVNFQPEDETRRTR